MSLIQTPTSNDLTGRILALNMNVCRRFQCGGFALSTSRPFAVVEPGAQQNRLHEALIDGRLLDITDQNVQGLGVSGTSHSPARELEEKGKKVYLQLGANGSLLVVCPKDEEDEKRREEEIAQHGVLAINEDEVTLSEVPFDTSGKVDQGTAQQILSGMTEKVFGSGSKNVN